MEQNKLNNALENYAKAIENLTKQTHLLTEELTNQNKTEETPKQPAEPADG